MAPILSAVVSAAIAACLAIWIHQYRQQQAAYQEQLDLEQLLDTTSEVHAKCWHQQAPGAGSPSDDMSKSQNHYCEADMPHPGLEEMEDTDEFRLVQIHVLHRHGDRSPISPLPVEDTAWDKCSHPPDTVASHVSDEDSRRRNLAFERVVYNHSPLQGPGMWKGNCNTGQLSDKGHKQMIQLGDIIGRRYFTKSDLFVEPPTLDSIHIQSTDVWRTQQSAQSLFKGLYPHIGSGAERKVDAVSSVKIYIRPKVIDPMSVPAKSHETCPRLSQLYALNRKNICFDAFKATSRAIRSQLDDIMGLDPSEKERGEQNLDLWYDQLRCRDCQNFPLPCRKSDSSMCVSEPLLKNIFMMGGWWARNEFYAGRWNTSGGLEEKLRREEARLRIGPLLGEIMSRIEDGKKSGKNVFLYSAHDTTVSGVLSALESRDRAWPPYASSVIVEVWQSLDEMAGKYVRVLYNGKELISPWCKKGLCNLIDWKSGLSTIIPEKFEQECRLK